MSNTIGEKIGVALAFIPGVSTVVGIIKAKNYYNRSYKSLDSEKDSFEVEKIKNTAKQSFFHKTAECERGLFKVSLAEMIPGVNIIAAFVELYLLSKLSKLREPDIYNKHFEVEPLTTPEKNKMLTDTLDLVDKVEIPFGEKKVLAQILRGNCLRDNDNTNPEAKVKYFLQSRLKDVISILSKNTAELEKLNADKNKAQPTWKDVEFDGSSVTKILTEGEPPVFTEIRDEKIKKLIEANEYYIKLQPQLESAISKFNSVA